MRKNEKLPLVGEMVTAAYALYGHMKAAEPRQTVVTGDRCVVVRFSGPYWVDLLTPRGELITVATSHLLEWRKTP